MNMSEQPMRYRIVRGCSRLLGWGGAGVFLLGGKFLYEIRHHSFGASEAIGMLGGMLLMLLGWLIAPKDKHVT